MASVRKKGQTIHSESREVIRNVIKQCDEETKEERLKLLLTQPNLRVSSYNAMRDTTRLRGTLLIP